MTYIKLTFNTSPIFSCTLNENGLLKAHLFLNFLLFFWLFTFSGRFEVIGEENTGRVDYAIKALEELICIMEGKQYQIAIGFAHKKK